MVVSRSVWKIRTRFPVAEISLLRNAHGERPAALSRAVRLCRYAVASKTVASLDDVTRASQQRFIVIGMLCVVNGEPSFWPHTNKHIPEHPPLVFDPSVAQFGAEITAREGAFVAIKIRRFDRNDRPFHADVLIRAHFRCHTQTESARALQQLSLSRRPASYDSDLASWLVGIPNRNHERPMTVFRNADDGHVKVGQKCLPFFLRHRERYRRDTQRLS